MDLPFIILAKIAGIPTYIHHHSFAYLNNYSLLSHILFSCNKRSTHIVLCEDMGTTLARRYSISKSQIRTLSNFSLFSESSDSQNERAANQPISLGFLSNITREKGIFIFLDLLDSLNARGLNFQAKIAGPVDPKIANEFKARIDGNESINYLGPVYNDDKLNFYSSIDILLFPTIYENEAAPLTIIEALQFGVLVIACPRGCIGCMLQQPSGYYFPEDKFIDEASNLIATLSSDPEQLNLARLAAKAAFDKGHQESRNSLATIVNNICGLNKS